MIDRKFLIQKLRKVINIDYINIFDDSNIHKNHPETKKWGGGHYSILIVSADFEGKNLIERHRKVYDALAEKIGTDIHALAITTKTPEEYNP